MDSLLASAGPIPKLSKTTGLIQLPRYPSPPVPGPVDTDGVPGEHE